MADDVTEPKVHNTGLVEMSMRISKASYNKSEKSAMRWTAVDSDIDSDLYDERMSIELYRDFVDRIEKGVPVPEPFLEAICEADWCGGVPYLSIAHFKAGTGAMNVPGLVESVFVDGTRLKSKGTLHDTEMGRRVFDALREDLYMKEKSVDHKPVRISIGFLDLEHKHLARAGGQEFTFTRSGVGQICPLCAQGIGGKIYMKGQLIHLAMTRVPVNPRTEMSLTERSMDEITTKKQDAASIIGDDLANELEEKSIASDMLVVRSNENGTEPVSETSDISHCYDPNLGTWDEACIRGVMDKYMPSIRKEIGEPVVKSTALPKELLDVMVAQMYKSNGYEIPVVEDKMETETTDKATVVGVPVKPFSHTQDGVTVTGDGNPEIASPVPTKAKEEEDEAPEMKSALDTSFESLKSLVEKARNGELDVNAINTAFAAMGTEVEKAVKPASSPVDAGDLVAQFKSMLDEALTPLRTDIAVLKAGNVKAPVARQDGVVQSKALSLNFGAQKPEEIIKRAVAPAGASTEPTRKLSQIEQLARKSTGVL